MRLLDIPPNPLDKEVSPQLPVVGLADGGECAAVECMSMEEGYGDGRFANRVG